MKTTLILAAVLLGFKLPANASSLGFYRCTSTADSRDVFPVVQSGGNFRVAISLGSSSYFDLEMMADPPGWPHYADGVYYCGADDVWVLFMKGNSLHILKPLIHVPYGTEYDCAPIPEIKRDDG